MLKCVLDGARHSHSLSRERSTTSSRSNATSLPLGCLVTHRSATPQRRTPAPRPLSSPFRRLSPPSSAPRRRADRRLVRVTPSPQGHVRGPGDALRRPSGRRSSPRPGSGLRTPLGRDRRRRHPPDLWDPWGAMGAAGTGRSGGRTGPRDWIRSTPSFLRLLRRRPQRGRAAGAPGGMTQPTLALCQSAVLGSRGPRRARTTRRRSRLRPRTVTRPPRRLAGSRRSLSRVQRVCHPRPLPARRVVAALRASCTSA